ncbi:MAG: hydrogenase small subunit [Anaerolineae bacterium]
MPLVPLRPTSSSTQSPWTTIIIAVGSCAAFGGLPKVTPNPTGAVGVMDLVKHIPVVNLFGCPMNVVNFTALVVHYLTFGIFPALDRLHRPLFAHGQIIHNNCERRAHFDAGEFVRAWGDEGHRKGWCLYKMGCKGPVATFNCPSVRWNDGVSWPIGAGHPCIACAAPDFFEREAYTVVDIQQANPPALYPPVEKPPEPISAGGAATLGAVGGWLVGGGIATAVATARREAQESPPAADG